MKTSVRSLVNKLSLISSEPGEEAKIILSNLLNKRLTELTLSDSLKLTIEQSSKLKNILEQRKLGKPLQYILQEAWFYKYPFYVDERVLIPRPETEFLIEKVLRYLPEWNKAESDPSHIGQDELARGKKIVIADIGTGCGCVAISLALELDKHILPFCKEKLEGVAHENSQIVIYATDISEEALMVAKLNATQILCPFSDDPDRLDQKKLPIPNLKPYPLIPHFLHGSLLDPLHEPVNIIVANLPYIPSERILKLQTEVKDWEPRVALDGGEDGFDLYRQLLSQLMSKWQSPGLFLAEIDYTQRELAVREFKQYFPNLRAKVTVDPIMKQTFLVAEFQLLTEELRA